DPLNAMKFGLIYYNIAIQLYHIRQNDESLSCFLISERLLCNTYKSKVSKILLELYQNIGYIYYMINEIEKALHYIKKVKEHIKETTDEKKSLPYVLIHISECQHLLGINEILKTDKSRAILVALCRLLSLQAQNF